MAVAALLLGALATPAPALAAVQWTDATAQAGVSFRTAGEVHPAGDNPDDWPAFPELIGGGACFADFDGDGYDDLYLVNQVYNAENPAVKPSWATKADPHNQLYLNDGDGTFTDTSEDAGVDSRGWGYGCSAADYDADGYVDLFVANFGDNELFRNQGDGTFANVSASSGVDMAEACGNHLCLSTSSAWADYDLDGDLDLYVANFLETNTTDTLVGPAGHVAQVNWLHRNNGDGTFTGVGGPAGVAGNPTDQDGGKTLGVVWFDHDLDGDPDLFAANDGQPDDFYVNEGDGTFTERSDAAGVADPRAGMGVATGDYDNDGYPDLHITHFEHEHNGFYRNNGDGTFEDRSGEDDLANHWAYVGWGTAFVDFDRDADLDLVAVNGDASPSSVREYSQPKQVFRNDVEPEPQGPGDRRWTDVTSTSGSGIVGKRVARGAAFADYDFDGDTDFAAVPNANQTAQVLQAAGNTNAWLTVQLRQPGANRFAIGARVAVEAEGVVQVREVQAGSSYLSQNTLNLEFGLGSLGKADRVTVHWPGGGTTVVSDVLADRVARIDQSTGLVAYDTLAPSTRATLEGTAGDDGWWRSEVRATLSAQDRGVGGVSGLAGTEYRVDDGAWAPYEGQALPLGEGRHTLRMRSTDLAGNQEPVRTEEVDVDLTPPALEHTLEGTPGDNGWWVSDSVDVTLRASDALSGVRRISYRVDGGDWEVYTRPFELEDDGTYRVEATARDVAGNEAPVAAFEVKLDHTPPAVAVVRPDIGHVYWSDRDMADLITGPAYIVATPALNDLGGPVFTLKAAASDATSGVARVAFSASGDPLGTDVAAPFTWPWNVGLESAGLYRIKAVAHDAAGNTAEDRTRVVLGPATLEGLMGTLNEGPKVDPGPALGESLHPMPHMPEPPDPGSFPE